MPPLAIEFSSRFRADIRKLPAAQQPQVAQAVALLSSAIGQPHLHAGLGIRRLTGAYLEFRAGRDIRVVFKLERSTASLLLVGNHDDVRRYLKGL